MVTQDQINQFKWYHDFDFPGGLSARMHDPINAAYYRLMWRFIAEQLRAVDFTGKSVIDIGCWDGYFSFLMEQRGATSVLAVDDFSQNWGNVDSFRLARELYQSKVELMPDVSVYEVSRRVQKKFDVIFFSGVFYHLHAPFLAFAEIRALCHSQTQVIVVGQCFRDEEQSYARFHLHEPHGSKFLPTARLVREMLNAAYFQVASSTFLSDMKGEERVRAVSREDLLRLARLAVVDKRAERTTPDKIDLIYLVAQPFIGKNNFHLYPPPFGLAQFDPRWAK